MNKPSRDSSQIEEDANKIFSLYNAAPKAGDQTEPLQTVDDSSDTSDTLSWENYSQDSSTTNSSSTGGSNKSSEVGLSDDTSSLSSIANLNSGEEMIVSPKLDCFFQLIFLLKGYSDKEMKHLLCQLFAKTFDKDAKNRLLADLNRKDELDEIKQLYLGDQESVQTGRKQLKGLATDQQKVQKIKAVLSLQEGQLLLEDVHFLAKVFSLLEEFKQLHNRTLVDDPKFYTLCSRLKAFEDEQRLIDFLIEKVDRSSDEELSEDLYIIKGVKDLFEHYDRYSFYQLIRLLSNSKRLEKVYQCCQKKLWNNNLFAQNLSVLHKVLTDSNSDDASNAFFEKLDPMVDEVMKGGSELELSRQLRAFLYYAPEPLRGKLSDYLTQKIFALYSSDETPRIVFLAFVLNLFVDDPSRDENRFISNVKRSINERIASVSDDRNREKKQRLRDDIAIYLGSAKIVNAVQCWDNDSEKFSWGKVFEWLNNHWFSRTGVKVSEGSNLERLFDSFLMGPPLTSKKRQSFSGHQVEKVKANNSHARRNSSGSLQVRSGKLKRGRSFSSNISTQTNGSH